MNIVLLVERREGEKGKVVVWEGKAERSRVLLKSQEEKRKAMRNAPRTERRFLLDRVMHFFLLFFPIAQVTRP